MRGSGKSLKVTVNEAPRTGPGMIEKPVHPPKLRIRAFVDGLQPGIDPDKMNRLADKLEAILQPGRRHATIVFDLLERLGAAGNLTTDAHLAALAIEHQCQLCTTDGDFSLFPGLHWSNPLTAAQ